MEPNIDESIKDVYEENDRGEVILSSIQKIDDSDINYEENITDKKIENTETHLRKTIPENLDNDCVASLDKIITDLKLKLEQALVAKDNAIREKESIVVRYATTEKNSMEEKRLREMTEKKLKEIESENEFLSKKCQMMKTEKMRISQMYDNKCYELKGVQQELEQMRSKLSTHRTELKETGTSSYSTQDNDDYVEKIKKIARESIDALKRQLKEEQAAVILLKHERADKDQVMVSLKANLNNLQKEQATKQMENKNLSDKLCKIEHEKLELISEQSKMEKQLANQRKDLEELQKRYEEVNELRKNLVVAKDKYSSAKQLILQLEETNQSLNEEMQCMKIHEKETLQYVELTTEQHVQLQSKFNLMETKIEQLSLEPTLLKRQIKEQSDKIIQLSSKLWKLRVQYEKNTVEVNATIKLCDRYKQEICDMKNDKLLMQKKIEMLTKEMTQEIEKLKNELQRKHCEFSTITKSNTNSNKEQKLIDQIVKLQETNAKKSERLDYLEEHARDLSFELRKKSQILQSYILKSQERSQTDNYNTTDENKAARMSNINRYSIAKSVLRLKKCLSLELCLEINRKLQNALEDALHENIILKESVDMLGEEINNLKKSANCKS